MAEVVKAGMAPDLLHNSSALTYALSPMGPSARSPTCAYRTQSWSNNIPNPLGLYR